MAIEQVAGEDGNFPALGGAESNAGVDQRVARNDGIGRTGRIAEHAGPREGIGADEQLARPDQDGVFPADRA